MSLKINTVYKEAEQDAQLLYCYIHATRLETCAEFQSPSEVQVHSIFQVKTPSNTPVLLVVPRFAEEFISEEEKKHYWKDYNVNSITSIA